jgi:hypothetical protein
MNPLKILVAFLICLAVCLSVKAQHVKTNDSTISQLKNNQQPGALNAPVTNTATPATKRMNIPGLPVAQATNAFANRVNTKPSTTTTTKKIPLPSDQPAPSQPVPLLKENITKQ